MLFFFFVVAAVVFLFFFFYLAVNLNFQLLRQSIKGRTFKTESELF